MSTTKRPLVIGVTGGIASGKSTVARMIAGRGILHVDADAIVHQLLAQDRDTIAKIAAAFPECTKPCHALQSSPHAGEPKPSWVLVGGINRAALARHITQHPQSLATLESILHPRVRAAELEAIANATRNRLRAVVLDIPLLFETDADQLCDLVIVAYAPLTHRRRRAFARAGMTEEKWQRLLARQLPDHHRHPRADVVVRTGAGKAATRRAVKAMIRQFGL